MLSNAGKDAGRIKIGATCASADHSNDESPFLLAKSLIEGTPTVALAGVGTSDVEVVLGLACPQIVGG